MSTPDPTPLDQSPRLAADDSPHDHAAAADPERDPGTDAGAAGPAEPVGPADIGPARALGERPPSPVAQGRLSGIQLSIVIVALMAGAALFLSGYSLGRQAATTPGTPGSEQAAFVPFWDTYHAITEQFAGAVVDRKTVIEGAIRGMIESLGDPYSSYLSSEEYKRSLQGISGQFEGVGAEIGARKSDGSGDQCSPLGPDCQMVVLAPIEGAPAEKAGIMAADVITEVDGVSVDGLTVNDAVARIRGPKDSTVVLTIVRDGEAPIQIPVVRDVVATREVITRDLAGGDVRYIRLTGFSDNSAKEFDKILAEGIAAGQRKIIVDLRGNPGGFVTAARDIASQFIASGPIYWQEDSKGSMVSSEAEPDGAATGPGIQVVVLIDRGSASASEILAGALQDTKRATLVGQQSYGKGTIQEWQPLPNDTGGFRLTIAKWLTPNKHWIHGTGLTPDVVVDVPDTTPPGEDPILDKALEVLGAASATMLQVAA